MAADTSVEELLGAQKVILEREFLILELSQWCFTDRETTEYVPKFSKKTRTHLIEAFSILTWITPWLNPVAHHENFLISFNCVLRESVFEQVVAGDRGKVSPSFPASETLEAI